MVWDELPMMVPVSSCSLKRYISSCNLYLRELTWSEMNNIAGNYDWIIPLTMIHLHIGVERQFAKPVLVLQPFTFGTYIAYIYSFLISLRKCPIKMACCLRRKLAAWKVLVQLPEEGHAWCVQNLMSGRRWKQWEPGQGSCSLRRMHLSNWTKTQSGILLEAETYGSLLASFLLFILSRINHEYVSDIEAFLSFPTKFQVLDALSPSSRTVWRGHRINALFYSFDYGEDILCTWI